MIKIDAAILAAVVAALVAGCQPSGGPAAVRPDSVWQTGGAYLCRRARGPIAVDGKWHHDQWAHAMVMAGFVVPASGAKAKDQTEMRMLWDDDCLYVHFVAHDADLRGTHTGKTDPIWSEDAVEVFFVPDMAKGSYYELEVNPINALLALQIADTRRGTLAERADWTHGIRRATLAIGTVNSPDDADKCFKVVLAIPWRDLAFAGGKPPRRGDTWRFVGARCNLSEGFAKQREYSACTPLSKLDFHINPDYAQMKFVE